MAYDEDLANRIRELIAAEPDLTEKRMFGGLAFLIGGNMSVAASGQGGAVVGGGPGRAGGARRPGGDRHAARRAACGPVRDARPRDAGLGARRLRGTPDE